MTIQNTITVPMARQTRNLMSAAFDVLICRLRQLYAAERECVGLPDGDPAFDAWLLDAESARAAVVAAARVVTRMPATADQAAHNDLAKEVIALFEADQASRYAEAAQKLMSVQPRLPQINDLQSEIARLLTLPDYAVDPGLIDQIAIAQAA